jgi:hypothetical protein
MTLWSLVGVYQRFEGTYCLHLQVTRSRVYVFPKRWYWTTRCHNPRDHNLYLNTLNTSNLALGLPCIVSVSAVGDVWVSKL